MNPQATAISADLAREIRKPEPLPPLTLHGILEDVQQLEQARDEAEAEGDAAAVSAIEQEFSRYLDSHVLAKKIDGIAAWIRECDACADRMEAEGKRMLERASHWRARRDRVKASTLYAMQSHGLKAIESAGNRLRVHGNGGLQPIEVRTAALPQKYMDATVRIPVDALLELVDAMRDTRLSRVVPAWMPPLMRAVSDSAWEPANGRIREALRTGEVVPGAKLLERGAHLVVD